MRDYISSEAPMGAPPAANMLYIHTKTTGTDVYYSLDTTDVGDWVLYASLSLSSYTQGFIASGGNDARLRVEVFSQTAAGNGSVFGTLPQSGWKNACFSDPAGAGNCFSTGGSYFGSLNYINQWAAGTANNAIDWGDLVNTKDSHSGQCGPNYGFTSGAGIGGIQIDKTDYNTQANATDFGGDLATNNWLAYGGWSATYGYHVGGTTVTKAQYWAFDTAADATTWGDMVATRKEHACASDIIGSRLFAFCGYATAMTNSVEKFDTSTASDAVSFGTLITSRSALAGISGDNKGWAACGYNAKNELEYLDYDTSGTGTDWGDATDNEYFLCGCNG
jgi:hypothetical protein